MVLQDARYARDLKSSIKYFQDKITVIDVRLATETDPVVIADLQSQKARYQSLKAASESELTSIRTLVETLTLTFTVQ